MEGLNNETKDENTLKSYKGLIIEAIPIAITTSIDANMNPSPTKNMPFTKKQIDLSTGSWENLKCLHLPFACGQFG